MKITGIRYELYLTYEEVETLKKHMEESDWAETVVVPFYGKDGHYDPNMYEVLTVRDFCTRHLFDADCQHGAARWGFDGKVFRAGVNGFDLMMLLRMMHFKLGTAIPDVMTQEEAAREQLYREHREIYLRDDMEVCIAWTIDALTDVRFWK